MIKYIVMKDKNIRLKRKQKNIKTTPPSAGLRRNRGDLAVIIQRQADQIIIKNKQLQNGAKKQIRSDEQIHILTEAIESAAEGIFIIDAQKPSLPVIYENQSFKTMPGYAKEEILSRNYSSPGTANADLRINEKINQMICRDRSFDGEMFWFQHNGKTYWYLLRITPIRDRSGAVTHYVGIRTDVTLMRERELQVNEQREELLHVTRVGKLAEFVSSLAHEISQPLTSILSYAQAAKRMLADRAPEVRNILSYIIDDDQRAAEVIRRMRLLLKKSAPEMVSLNINDLIGRTIVLIATDAAARHNTIKTHLDSTLPLVCGDHIQLQQVLLNLISNSFDALENNRGAREILISTSRNKGDDMIVVTVKDSGSGINAKNMPKLFTRFFTSKPDGLGMGLSISRSIVETHGGRLSVKNNPTRGATFYFTIPIGTKSA